MPTDNPQTFGAAAQGEGSSETAAPALVVVAQDPPTSEPGDTDSSATRTRRTLTWDEFCQLQGPCHC
jgi:hypothetical protein